MKKYSFILILAILLSCGKKNSPNITKTLRLQFPSTLSKNSSRYQRFLKQANHLALNLSSNNEKPKTYIYPVTKWDNIVLPSLLFPEQPKDKLKIQVEVWDRKQSGQIRSFPVLKGESHVKADNIDSQLVIKLSLQVSSSEWD